MINNSSKGFIAITTTMILSVILLVVATSLSFSGFFTRYNILDSELKKVSVALAEGCVDQGLLMLATQTYTTSTTTIKIGEKYCDLGPVPSTGNPRLLHTQASSSKYYTNLTIEADEDTLKISCWIETPGNICP